MPKSGENITLVLYPASQALIAQTITLKEELTIKAGTPDSYVPKK
jgi:hypothetical protein